MEFLEVPLYDDDVWKLGVRFLFNIFFMALMLFLAIKPAKTSHDFVFTVVMMNVTTFFICFALKKLDLGLGMALGLFAIFGVLRYRTDTIRTKEMTYLFIVIGIAVINALSNKKTSYAELLFVNFAILSLAILKETFLFKAATGDENGNGNGKLNGNGKGSDKPPSEVAPKAPKFQVQYDRLELLGDETSEVLIADLKQRTHVDIARVRIQSIDLQQNVATLTVWQNPPTTAAEPAE